MEEKRIERVGDCMKTFADVDRQVLPIVGKCLDGMTKAAESIDAKTVSSRPTTRKRTGSYARTQRVTHTRSRPGSRVLSQGSPVQRFSTLKPGLYSCVKCCT